MRLPFPGLAIALVVTASARADCDEPFLAALDPGIGEVLSREPLPRDVTRQVEVEIVRREVPCAPEESDEACVARVTDEQADLPEAGQRLVVEVEGPYLGVRAVFRDGDREFEQDFESYEDAAAWMETEQLEQPGLVLVRAGHRRDPAKRIAAARAVEDRTETVDLGPGLRIRLRVTEPFSEALRAFHAIESVTVIRWDSDAEGTATVELRCRGSGIPADPLTEETTGGRHSRR